MAGGKRGQSRTAVISVGGDTDKEMTISLSVDAFPLERLTLRKGAMVLRKHEPGEQGDDRIARS